MSLREKSLQEIYDTTLNHLRHQGHAAVLAPTEQDDGPSCAYLCENGDKCAVGIHIPAEKYTPEFEGQSCNSSSIAMALDIYDSLPKSSLLNGLQDAHDFNLAGVGAAAWERRMKRIADDFNLVYTPPEGASA